MLIKGTRRIQMQKARNLFRPTIDMCIDKSIASTVFKMFAQNRMFFLYRSFKIMTFVIGDHSLITARESIYLSEINSFLTYVFNSKDIYCRVFPVFI